MNDAAQLDETLIEAMTRLEPGSEAVRRMGRRIEAAFEADHTSLFAEWIELVRVSPLAGIGYCLAGATALLLTPIGSLLAWIFAFS